jgi:succinyl-diaminopimelate desuccinylase
LAANPIHSGIPALNELTREIWDQGNDSFPATSFQISNINGGSGATNVIPGTVEVLFNFRFSTELTEGQLRDRTEAILDKYPIEYEAEWNLSGQPFLTVKGDLVEAAITSIAKVTGLESELSTAGGTSDGRFIAPMGTEVVELGPINESIHRVDENVSIADLDVLTAIYQDILQQLLS